MNQKVKGAVQAPFLKNELPGFVKPMENDLMNGGGMHCSSFMEYLKILKIG